MFVFLTRLFSARVLCVVGAVGISFTCVRVVAEFPFVDEASNVRSAPPLLIVDGRNKRFGQLVVIHLLGTSSIHRNLTPMTFLSSEQAVVSGVSHFLFRHMSVLVNTQEN